MSSSGLGAREVARQAAAEWLPRITCVNFFCGPGGRGAPLLSRASLVDKTVVGFYREDPTSLAVAS